MGNIIDYIVQYGHKDFSVKPFNDVDGLILSQFSYLKMDGLVPQVGTFEKSVTVSDMMMNPHVDDLFADERYAKNNRELFETMAKSKRFGCIELNHYINLVSKKWEMQFSAVTCKLPGGMTYVVYRGTDESIVGWKEDFNMAFMTPIPAQIKAVDYLNYVAERIRGEFMVGGHSKGGNLAVYASVKCPKITQNRIKMIHSFDGPGFTKTAFTDEEFEHINSKVRKIVPHSSLVGMLLQTHENYSVVEAKSFGILQHDPFNWVVEGDDFVYRSDVSDAANLQNSSINEWSQNTDPEEMRKFISQMYDVIDTVGVTDLNDFKGNYPELIVKFTTAIDGLDDSQKDLMKNLFKRLLNIFIETVKTQSGISIINELDKIGKKSI